MVESDIGDFTDQIAAFVEYEHRPLCGIRHVYPLVLNNDSGRFCKTAEEIAAFTEALHELTAGCELTYPCIAPIAHVEGSIPIIRKVLRPEEISLADTARAEGSPTSAARV